MEEEEAEEDSGTPEGWYRCVRGGDRHMAGDRKEESVCRNCRSREVENVEHWLLRCTGMAEEREKLIMTMRKTWSGRVWRMTRELRWC